MRWMSNRERAERKAKKAVNVANNTKKQIHTSYHSKAGYHTIIQSVKSKINHWVLLNEHSRKKVDKLILIPKVIWNNGTYIRKVHGPIGRQRFLGTRRNYA